MQNIPEENNRLEKEESSQSYSPEVISGIESGEKNSMLDSVKKSKNLIQKSLIGSKSFPAEIRNLKDSYVGFYKQSVGSTLKSAKKLVTLHPVDAVKEFATGTMGNLKNVANIVTSPARFAVAGVSNVASTAKSVAKLPFKVAKGLAESPLWVWNKLNKGADRLFSVGQKFQTWNKG